MGSFTLSRYLTTFARIQITRGMHRFYTIVNLVNHYKYLIVVVAGILIVGVVDENSFMKRIQLEWRISDLKSEIGKYKVRNEANTAKLKELKRNPEAIKKIARENYFMKADDEDIFVLSSDQKKKKSDFDK